MTTPACLKEASQIRQSQWLRDTKHVPRYLKAMCSPCWSVRYTAEDAFVLMPAQKTEIILHGNLKKADVPVNACLRSSSLTALTRVLGYDKSIAPAIRYLKDPSVAVRRAAVKILRNIPWLGSSRGSVLPLIGALADTDAKVRADAAYTLGLIKDPRAVVPLIRMLKDPRVSEKVAALNGLVFFSKDRRALPLIRPLLAHGEARLRMEAMRTLYYVHDTYSAPLIRRMLVDSDVKIRLKALHVVFTFEGSRALAAIAARLSDSSRAVQKSAIDTLASLCNMRAIPYLKRAGAAHPWMRREVAAAIGYIEGANEPHGGK